MNLEAFSFQQRDQHSGCAPRAKHTDSWQHVSATHWDLLRVNHGQPYKHPNNLLFTSLSRALLYGEMMVPVKINEHTKEHFLMNLRLFPYII